MKHLLLIVIMGMNFTLFAQHLLPVNRHVPVPKRNVLLSSSSSGQARPMTPSEYLYENFDNGIPATWTVIDSAGTGAVWQGVTDYYDATLDGTPFAMADSDGAGNVNMDTYLESPVININNNGAPVYLVFDHFYLNYSGNEKGDVEVYDGTQWVLLERYQGDNYGDWDAPEHKIFEVTYLVNPSFKVRFHYYDAHYDFYWAVDNVRVYSPDANDLSMDIWATPYAGIVNEATFFSAVVYNNGYALQNDFSVRAEVLDSNDSLVFTTTENITGAGLAAFEKKKINFSNSWTPTAEGDFTIRYTVNLAGDEDNSNDTWEIPHTARNFRYEAGKIYSFVAYDADQSGDQNYLGYFDAASGAFTPVDSISGMIGDFFTGGEFADFFDHPVLIAADIYNIVYFVHGNGKAYPYGVVPIENDVITGFALRANGSPYFSTSKSLYILTPYLDTLKVGDYNLVDPVMVGITMDNTGNVYGIDLESDKLYSINTSNAQVTEIGPLGVDVDYIQDIGYDRENNVLYGTLYTINGNTSESGLYTIDTSTGQATLVGSASTDNFAICAVAPSNVLQADKEVSLDWKMYPNPVHDMLHIQWKDMPDQWQVVNAQGKVLMEGSVEQKYQTIPVANLPKGMYWLRIRKGKNITAKAFLKK